MSILNKIFGNSSEPKEEKQVPWIPLNDQQQLKQISDLSKTKTQVIFKHSTSCSISRMVMNRFASVYEVTDQDLDLYYLDLLSYREVSNEVAKLFNVMHQSPQLLVIKDGKAVVHASHGAINEVGLGDYV